MGSWLYSSKRESYDQVRDKDEDSEPKLDQSRGHIVSQQAVQRLKRWLWAASMIATLACLALAVFIVNALVYTPQHYRYNGPSPVPEMPTEIVTFNRDERYTATSNSASDREWESLMPPGGGFVSLPDSANFNMPPGLPDQNNASIYDVSMFHQLHCLTQLRGHLFKLKFALEKNETQRQWIQDVLLDPQEDHVFHCFDYLRQAVMCAGDLTLEWPREEPDGRRFAFDGWNMKHKCVSWVAIQQFMGEHTPFYIANDATETA